MFLRLCLLQEIDNGLGKKNKQKKKNTCLKIPKTSADTRGLHRQLAPIGHSETQILEFKMDHRPIKAIITIKAMNKYNPNYYLQLV